MTSTTRAERVLFIGQQPETVDFSDPSLPPGFDAAKIRTPASTSKRTRTRTSASGIGASVGHPVAA